VVEEMGGDVQDVEVSAKTGAGLDTLIEKILLQAELLELKSNPDRAAEATVIEAQLDKGTRPVATVLVGRGTLRVGDIFVVGDPVGQAFARWSTTRVEHQGSRAVHAGRGAGPFRRADGGRSALRGRERGPRPRGRRLSRRAGDEAHHRRADQFRAYVLGD
jgi:hypothetical protein